ncbi:siroheme synthase CysG [Litoribacillus peritrichatus]|uniref:Siroheme synthase n=1 Tax=Litoribacillus peritrichatus TaxID=718191 RepID=A0ABP7N146_9GAMM
MEFLPLFHKLSDHPCLVVGGGVIASRRAHILLQAGADVTVISPEIDSTLQASVDDDKIKWIRSLFDVDALAPMQPKLRLIVAATDNDTVNQVVADYAADHNIPVNVASDASKGDVIFPSIIDRSPVIAAVASGSKSPVISRLLRGTIEAALPAHIGKLTDLAGEYRAKVKSVIGDMNRRRAFWERFFQGPAGAAALANDSDTARSMLEESLENFDADKHPGEVYLIGAGPGDPDLLTLKALRLIQQADVVFYDRLVSKPILDLCRRDAKLVDVGKARSNHTVPQDQINLKLVEFAQKGHRVLRLKGGDPFIFGRGGEELEELAKSDVPFQIVPGITAASGCAAYSGIPLTHRDYSQSVRFITGHLKNNTCDLPWHEYAHENQTLVFYMGLVGLPLICNSLIEHGMKAEMPIALVQKGTTPEQRVLVGTLETMPELVKQNEIKAPTLIIIGEVVNLHDKLAWYRSAE